jgi:molybdenum cofactor cytidylyltransferase
VEADGSKMRPAKAPAAHEPVLPATTTILAPVLGLDAVGAEITPRTFHRAELVREVLGLPPEAAGANPAADPFRQTRLTPRHAGELLVHAAGGAKARPPGARLLPIFNKADQPLRLAYGRLAAGGLAQAGTPSLLAAVGRTEGAPVVERWGEVAVVILAAGAATRFGSPKQLAAVNGRPMLLSALAAAAALSGPIHVITGAHVGPVQEALAHLPPPLAHQLGGRLRVVHNPQWASGQASSLHASIHSLRANTAAAIWMPVDQPYLEATLLTQLVGAWRRGADLAAPVADGILRGAPALFDRRLWPELLAIRDDSGGRRVLQQHAAAVTPIPTSAASLQDIDTPQQLT